MTTPIHETLSVVCDQLEETCSVRRVEAEVTGLKEDRSVVVRYYGANEISINARAVPQVAQQALEKEFNRMPPEEFNTFYGFQATIQINLLERSLRLAIVPHEVGALSDGVYDPSQLLADHGEVFRKQNASWVYLHYDGSGDEGWINKVDLYRREAGQDQLVIRWGDQDGWSGEVADALFETFEDLLVGENPMLWYDQETGSRGEMYLWVDPNQVLEDQPDADRFNRWTTMHRVTYGSNQRESFIQTLDLATGKAHTDRIEINEFLEEYGEEMDEWMEELGGSEETT